MNSNTDTDTEFRSAADATEAAEAADPTEATEPTATLPATPAGPPSVHVRAVITWLAIFPLVALGMLLIAPISESWHPVLRAFVLTLVVVPLAVYLVVPQLMRGYGRTRNARAERRGNV
jgi:antibiotic biosynthesis monooxygenase (ABM) superfamily enzyme